MTKKSSAAAFLENMKQEPAESLPSPDVREKITQGRGDKPPVGKRQGLKHIGGYFDTDMDEKFALLRARLKLDNSELIKLAIDTLYNDQKAKRAFNN